MASELLRMEEAYLDKPDPQEEPEHNCPGQDAKADQWNAVVFSWRGWLAEQITNHGDLAQSIVCTHCPWCGEELPCS